LLCPIAFDLATPERRASAVRTFADGAAGVGVGVGVGPAETGVGDGQAAKTAIAMTPATHARMLDNVLVRMHSLQL
jgi:hypothetical protein